MGASRRSFNITQRHIPSPPSSLPTRSAPVETSASPFRPTPLARRWSRRCHFGSPNPALDALVVWNRNSEEYPGDVRFEDDVALFSGRETKPTFVGLYGTFLCLTGLNLERLLALELKRTNFKLSEIVEVIRQACALEDLTISSERALHHDLTSVPASLPSASVVNFKLRLHAPPAHSLLNFFTWPRLQRMNFELFGSHSNCVQAVTRVAASLPGAGSELHVRISPGRVDLGMGPVRLALHTTSPGTAFELAITALPAELVGSIPQILWSHWRCHEVADPARAPSVGQSLPRRRDNARQKSPRR